MFFIKEYVNASSIWPTAKDHTDLGYIAGYVPTIEYLGTTTKGEKTFTLKCKGKHYKIYLREEVDTFVLEGDRNLVYDYKRVYGLKHNVNVIANYIADHYDEFGGNENE